MLPRFELPDRIALFPLAGAVLLPRAKLPLHIFEPRYLQMLEDSLKTNHRMIGMIQPHQDQLAEIGCAGRVVAFSELDDGRMMISLRAISRFRLIEADEGFSPYTLGRVDWSAFTRDLEGPESDSHMNREKLLLLLQKYAELRDISADPEEARTASDEVLINALSMIIPFSPGEKQALLEAKTLGDRRVLLEGLIEYALHGGESEDRMQ